MQSYQVRDKLAICFEIFAIIRQVFKYCVSYDYIEYSVCDRFEYKILFKPRNKKRHYKTIHEDELKSFVLYSNKALFNDLDITYIHITIILQNTKR